MKLSIHPDPAVRSGGYAFLAVPAGTLSDTSVTVAVMETYGERWLAPDESEGEIVEIGNPNWQSERVEFGPYAVHNHEGCDWVRVGPEIVNKIEEYTPLRISVGGVTEDIAWPDDVPPRAGAAVLGGLQTLASKGPEDDTGALVGRRSAPEPEPDPAPEETVVVPPPEPEELAVEEEEGDAAPRRNYLLPAILTVLALAAIVAAMLFLPQEEPTAGSTPPAEGTPDVASAEPCSRAALAAVPGGFGPISEAIRGCAGQVTPDTVLGLLEDAAGSGDPVALLLFGTLYDGAQIDTAIEDHIGLTFTDNPARAAEYYHRAAIAGSQEAPARLEGICGALAGMTSTLAKGAYDDYCG